MFWHMLTSLRILIMLAISAGLSAALRFSSVALSFFEKAAPVAAVLNNSDNQQAVLDANKAYQELSKVDCQGGFANRTFALRADQLAQLPLNGILSHVDMLLSPKLGSQKACLPEPTTFVKWTVRCTNNCRGTNDTLAALQQDPLVVDLALPQPEIPASLLPSSFSRPEFSRRMSQLLRRQNYSSAYSTAYTDESDFLSSVSSVAISLGNAMPLTGPVPSPTTQTTITTGIVSNSVTTATVTFQPISPDVSTGFEAFYDSGFCAAASSLHVPLTLLLFSLIIGSALVL